jgi:succinyl-diaminopimelate desuccinylase
MSGDLSATIQDHVDSDEVVEICRDLVRAPSVNPPGDESEVAAVTERWLGRLGLEAEFFSPEPSRTSTISAWGSGDKTLLFNGHYDVVPAPEDGWPHPPFGGVVEDGKIYGRGTTDMKSGIAACLGAVSALKRAGLKPSHRLLMHFVADEEALGSLGTEALVDQGYCKGVTEALVGEPTSLHIVPAERGTFWLRVITEGVAAHGSVPHLGRNAIEHMAHVIGHLKRMRFKKLHELLGTPTISIGTIKGGEKINMVAARCEIELDRRTLPGETQDEVVAEVQQVLDAAKEDLPELEAAVVVDHMAEASETPEGTSLFGLIDEACQAFGIETSEVGYSGATDARFLINQAKIPSVIFGPGELTLAHTTGEYVQVDQLVQATLAYAHIFARFLEAS